jgi:hypothetical protein
MDSKPSPAKLGSFQDRILMAVYYRLLQPKIFEQLITVYASMLQLSPDVTKKIDQAIQEYIELLVPGSKEIRNKAEKNFMKTQQNALESIMKAIQNNHSKNIGLKPS